MTACPCPSCCWLTAGLDPDLRSAARAFDVLDTVGAEGTWAWWLSLRRRGRWSGEVERLVVCALSIGDA